MSRNEFLDRCAFGSGKGFGCAKPSCRLCDLVHVWGERSFYKKPARRVKGCNPSAGGKMQIRIGYFLGDIRTPDDTNVK